MTRWAGRAFLGWLLVVGTLAAAPQASGVGAWVDFVYHPSITSQPESGRWIKDLAVKDGEVYMGYGDYGANTGPVAVATVSTLTGATGVKAVANTEEINTYRSFGGSLFAPWVDTRGVSGIYTSDQSGTWSDTGAAVENVHIFDVGVLPSGVQVAVGSANAADRSTYLGATAFVSRDGGATWAIGMTDLTSPKDQTVSGYERYYWVAVIGNVAYMQARDVAAIYGQAAFPLRSFNGYRWTSQNKSADCFETEGHQVEVFQGRAYCGNGRVFTGKRSTTRGGIHASDFYQHAGVLYALSSGWVMRLDGNAWSQVAAAPTDRARSVAVTDTHLYVGDGYGHVWRATR